MYSRQCFIKPGGHPCIVQGNMSAFVGTNERISDRQKRSDSSFVTACLTVTLTPLMEKKRASAMAIGYLPQNCSGPAGQTRQGRQMATGGSVGHQQDYYASQ